MQPEALRDLLFNAVASGDAAAVEKLCIEHRATILESFATWQRVPDAVRADPAAMQRYAQGLIAIARLFAQRLGSSQLLARLTGDPGDNPITQWQDDLRAAYDAMNDARYTDATEQLRALLDTTRDLQGTAGDQLRPITYGYLGECLFHLADTAAAIEQIERALDICVANGDVEGIQTYRRNLFEAHRYLGQTERAAKYADLLAEGLEARGEPGEPYRRAAARVRAGEPLLRVVALVDGEKRELDDISAVTGKIRLVFERNRLTLRPAVVLVERGRQAGGEGRFADALAMFQQAAAADRFDPEARYQEAFTLLHLKRYDEALAAYDATEQLAPGWFHCRADGWLARELAAGRVSHDVFLALHEIEDGTIPPAAKLERADAALATAPKLAPLHLMRGIQLARLDRVDDALAALRDGLACDPEPDVRTRLLVQLGLHTPDVVKRHELLGEAIELGGNLVAVATAKLMLRGQRAGTSA